MSKTYSNTSVNWMRSQGEIIKMLTARGVYQTRFTNIESKFVMEFLAPQPHGKPVGVRIIVPIQGHKDEKKREKELNRMHRVLFYHLKAKFVAIDSGLTEFSEEFMPHLIITDKNGNSSTMGEHLLPQYKEKHDSDDHKPFLLE